VAQHGGTAPAVFSRQASGLIRVGSSFDVFVYNVGLVSIGIAIAFNQFYGPSLYPGALTWVSTLLAALGMLAVATTFYFWSTVFPRSGGVYVFLSRSTHPGLAFVFSAIETVILLYYAALAASLIVTVGLSSFFSTVGLISGSQGLVDAGTSVATPSGVFWTGTAFLVAAGLLLASGTRRYFTFQRVLFVAAAVGMLVLLVVMVLGSRRGFAGNLQSLTGLEYDDVIAQARDNGYVSSDPDFGETLKFMVWPLLPLLGAVQSVGIGGEVKRVQRSQLFGMLGAVAATGAVIALFGLLSDKAFGYEFQGAIAYNALTGVAAGTTSTAPYFTVLAGILTSNVLLAVIIMAVFVAWIWFWIPAEIAYTTRSMIAWSFDRVAPDRLGRVSERFHTPVLAIAVSTAGSIGFMWLIAYRGIAFLTLIEVLLVVWGAAMVSAVFFPKSRSQMFESSPAARSRIAGVPTMAVAGAVSTVFFAAMIYLLWNDINAAGPLISSDGVSREFWIVLGIVLGATAWYLGTRAYRKRQGIDLDLAFQQIPIE
jgi:APA family basic amino acid/polyamine antiporter